MAFDQKQCRRLLARPSEFLVHGASHEKPTKDNPAIDCECCRTFPHIAEHGAHRKYSPSELTGPQRNLNHDPKRQPRGGRRGLWANFMPAAPRRLVHSCKVKIFKVTHCHVKRHMIGHFLNHLLEVILRHG